MGFGTAMHAYVERYFRAWEATEIELHVARTNEAALRFYRKMGYRYSDPEPRNAGMWRMVKALL
jgi:ribosomal protein S18 acetylase RimI-like enzyme